MTTTQFYEEMNSMATSAPQVAPPIEPSRRTEQRLPIPDRTILRLGALAGGIGLAAQIILDRLHPHHAQPNNSVAAFAEYAHAHGWAAVHIGQFFGVLLLGFALLVLSRSLARQSGFAGALATGGGIAVILLVGVFAVQMAVDGVALKHAVSTWANAGGGTKISALQVADAVRWIEKGLSAFFHMLTATALMTLGLSVVAGHKYRAWPGWVAIAAALGFLAGGISTATTGFSSQASTIVQPALLLLVVFLVATYASLWRTDGGLPPTEA